MMHSHTPSGQAQRSRATPWLMALGCVALVALIIWGIRSLASDAKAPARQVAKVVLLPDTAPPPPPPPPKEKPPEPPPSAKPAAQPVPEAPKTPPAPAPLKMEGAAGDGPSAFAAGSVTNDYRGGPTQIGGTPGGGASGPAVADRASERLYAGTVRQMLRDEIERHLGPDAGELTAGFALWISPQGRITRWQFEGAPEREAQQKDLTAALEQSANALQLPAPPGLTQPLRFRLTVRSGG